MAESESDVTRIDWQDDGRTANNPCPDWWEESSLRELGGVLIHTYHEGALERREVVDTVARLVELSATFQPDDEELARAIEIVEGRAGDAGDGGGR